MNAERLEKLRQELIQAIAALASEHHAAQTSLVLEHLDSVRGEPSALVGAPLCLGAARALGLGATEARQVALVIALAECSVAALRSLALPQDTDGVQSRHGLPLALNSSDALYSLAHMALAEYEASEGGRRHGLARTFDSVCLRLWQAGLGEGREARYLDDRAALSVWAGRLAGEMAARAAGRDASAALLGDFLAGVAGGQPPADAVRALDGGSLTQAERQALVALLEGRAG